MTPQPRTPKDIAGWLLLATLVYAPWAYACTGPRSIIGLDAAMGAVAAIWAVECWREKRIPHWPVWMWMPIAWLCFQGWCMAANAHFLYDRSTQTFAPNPNGLRFLPGAADTVIVSHVMWRYTGLLAMLLVAADLAIAPAWRRRLMHTMALTGFSIVLLALAQKLTGAHTIFWQHGTPSRMIFGTFFYHGNAGTFINLVLPPLLLSLFLALRNHGRGAPVVFWSFATAIVASAPFFNISKAGMALSSLLVLLATGGFAFLSRHPRDSLAGVRPWKLRHLLALVFGIFFAAAIGLLSSATLRWRWTEFFTQVGPDYPRVLLAQSMGKMLPESGFFGFGPGTLQFTLSHYLVSERIAGTWPFGHQDYLQTLVEWGWCGALAWGVLLFGGLVIAIKTLWSRGVSSLEDRAILLNSSLALMIILLHALGDFPLQIASLQLYTAIYVALGWSSPQWGRRES